MVAMVYIWCTQNGNASNIFRLSRKHKNVRSITKIVNKKNGLIIDIRSDSKSTLEQLQGISKMRHIILHRICKAIKSSEHPGIINYEINMVGSFLVYCCCLVLERDREFLYYCIHPCALSIASNEYGDDCISSEAWLGVI
jgi:hypothetical protein